MMIELLLSSKFVKLTGIPPSLICANEGQLKRAITVKRAILSENDSDSF